MKGIAVASVHEAVRRIRGVALAKWLEVAVRSQVIGAGFVRAPKQGLAAEPQQPPGDRRCRRSCIFSKTIPKATFATLRCAATQSSRSSSPVMPSLAHDASTECGHACDVLCSCRRVRVHRHWPRLQRLSLLPRVVANDAPPNGRGKEGKGLLVVVNIQDPEPDDVKGLSGDRSGSRTN